MTDRCTLQHCRSLLYVETSSLLSFKSDLKCQMETAGEAMWVLVGASGWPRKLAMSPGAPSQTLLPLNPWPASSGQPCVDIPPASRRLPKPDPNFLLRLPETGNHLWQESKLGATCCWWGERESLTVQQGGRTLLTSIRRANLLLFRERGRNGALFSFKPMSPHLTEEDWGEARFT